MQSRLDLRDPEANRYLTGNALVCGDNLDVLRELPNECVDLIYLDPPFNSNSNYAAIFGDKGRVEAQLRDIWRWTVDTEGVYRKLPRGRLLDCVNGVILQYGEESRMAAYAVFMGVRLAEMHRTLKATGALYLHCSPDANMILRILLDGIFGEDNFRNEIVWRRTGSHNSAKRFGPIHETILFYAKTERYQHQLVHMPYLKGHVDQYFKKQDNNGRYWTNSLLGAGTTKGESGRPWRGFDPTLMGRHWMIPSTLVEHFGVDPDLSQHEKLDALYQHGVVDLPGKSSKAMPTYRQYLHQSLGQRLQDIWAYQPHTHNCLQGTDACIDQDVSWVHHKQERVGYPTQKPLGLLERIIRSSSLENDLVLDPFCGCGTAADAAAMLGRRYLGIDISGIAVRVMEQRLRSRGGAIVPIVHGLQWSDYEWEEFERRARMHRDQTEDGTPGWAWAEDKVAGLLTAVPNNKKSSDGGVDARYFTEKGEIVPIQIKMHRESVGRPEMDKLLGAQTAMRNRGINAPMSVMVTLYQPTERLRVFAYQQGRVSLKDSEGVIDDYPVMQIVSVEEMLTRGERPKLPPVDPRCLVGDTQTRLITV